MTKELRYRRCYRLLRRTGQALQEEEEGGDESDEDDRDDREAVIDTARTEEEDEDLRVEEGEVGGEASEGEEGGEQAEAEEGSDDEAPMAYRAKARLPSDWFGAGAPPAPPPVAPGRHSGDGSGGHGGAWLGGEAPPRAPMKPKLNTSAVIAQRDGVEARGNDEAPGLTPASEVDGEGGGSSERRRSDRRPARRHTPSSTSHSHPRSRSPPPLARFKLPSARRLPSPSANRRSASSSRRSDQLYDTKKPLAERMAELRASRGFPPSNPKHARVPVTNSRQASQPAGAERQLQNV